MLLFTVCTVSAALILSSFLIQYRSGKNQVIAQLESVAEESKRDIGTWIDSLNGELRLFLQGSQVQESIRAVLKTDPSFMEMSAAGKDLQRGLITFGEAAHWTDEFFLLDLKGMIRASSKQENIGGVRSLQTYYLRGKLEAGTYVQALAYSKNSGAVNTVVATHPVKDAEGRIIGVICGRANLSRLNAALSVRTGLGSTGETYLVGENQVLLTDTKNPRFAAGSAFINTRAVAEALEKRTGGALQNITYDGAKTLCVYEWIPRLDAVLVAEKHLSEALRPVFMSLGIYAVLVLLAIGVATWGAFFLSRYITAPLKELASAADRLAAGHWEQPLTIDRDDEIGSLAASFKSMSRQLKAAFEERRHRDALLTGTLESTADGILVVDEAGVVTHYNARFEQMWGLEGRTGIGVLDRDLVEAVRPRLKEFGAFSERIDDLYHDPGPAEDLLHFRDGRVFERHSFPLRIDGAPRGRVWNFRDITAKITAEKEKTELQAQLLQSQKMEAIGQLAGGIAHDFNNMLTAIMGNAQLVQLTADTEGHETISRHSAKILKASARASEMTRKLLTFARRGEIRRDTFNIHDLIEEVCQLLSSIVDPRIEIRFLKNADRPIINGDAGQLQNALFNLALNARDAMPEGGIITFQTRNVNSSEGNRFAESPPRTGFVQIRVQDTGPGIPEDIRPKIFEPFFTTKKAGEGTGLGLASVYGCIQSHKGHIEVRCPKDGGTIFELLLKEAESGEKPARPPSDSGEPNRGSGHVMVIDDEEIVREFVSQALKRMGYLVTACAGGEEGLARFSNPDRPVDLVLLDMIMPGLSGEETFRRLKDIDESVRVVIVSGFSKGDGVKRMLAQGAVGFLPKPFLIEDLCRFLKHSPCS